MPIKIIDQKQEEKTAYYTKIICDFCIKLFKENYGLGYSAEEIALEIEIISVMEFELKLLGLKSNLEYAELENAFTYFGSGSKEYIVFALLIYNNDIQSTEKYKPPVFFYVEQK